MTRKKNSLKAIAGVNTDGLAGLSVAKPPRVVAPAPAEPAEVQSAGGGQAAAALSLAEPAPAGEQPSSALPAPPQPKPSRARRRVAGGGGTSASYRKGTVSEPYLRQRDQVETVQVSVMLPKELRKEARMHCLSHELNMSQVMESALQAYLKRA